MEQSMIGPSPNPLILSYLKYAISSQVRQNNILCKKPVSHTVMVLKVLLSIVLCRWSPIPVF